MSKNKHKQVFAIAATLVLAFVFSLTFTVVDAKFDSNFIPLKDSAEIFIKEGHYDRTSVKLIQVASLPNANVKNAINNTLKNEVVNFAKDYQSKIFESSFVDSKVMTNKNNILSVIFRENYYPAQAAHSTTLAKAYNFDLKTGKIYELSEIFKENSDYKKKLSLLTKEILIKNNDNLIESFNSIDDKQEFYLKDNSLVLFYQIYRYTPFAAGFLEIEISFTEVADILNDNFKTELL